jgi:hypothetical protein
MKGCSTSSFNAKAIETSSFNRLITNQFSFSTIFPKRVLKAFSQKTHTLKDEYRTEVDPILLHKFCQWKLLFEGKFGDNYYYHQNTGKWIFASKQKGKWNPCHSGTLQRIT